MKGTIRTIVGLLVTFGAVGGLDAGNDLVPCILLAVGGLALMASGVKAMKNA